MSIYHKIWFKYKKGIKQMHSFRNNYTLDRPQPNTACVLEASSSLLHSGPSLGDGRETLSTEGQLGRGIGGWGEVEKEWRTKTN